MTEGHTSDDKYLEGILKSMGVSFPISRKFGEIEVDLAVDGWHLYINVFPRHIAEVVEFLKTQYTEKGLETRVEDIAYDNIGSPVLDKKAIYIRAEGFRPRPPEKLIDEARQFKAKNRTEQEASLREVHRQIVTQCDGVYAEGFRKREDIIATILNYYIDKMRGFGLQREVDEVSAKVKKQFPWRDLENYSVVTHGQPRRGK